MARAQVLRQERGMVVLQLWGAQDAERRDSRTAVRAEVTHILGRQPQAPTRHMAAIALKERGPEGSEEGHCSLSHGL